MPPPINMTTMSILHQNPPMDDEEFVMSQKWEKFWKTMKIMYDINVATAVILGVLGVLMLPRQKEILYDINVATAVILGVLGVLMFLTIVSSKVRAHSPVWYLYHVIGMSVVTALVIHTFLHSGIMFRNRGACFFFIYTAEFFFLAFGFNILLLNVEIYFTRVLPLQKWEWSPFFRFVASILACWVAVLVTAIYAVINNNSGVSSNYHCFYIKDKSQRVVRMVLRSIIPAVLCFLCTLVFIGTHCLKRSRFTMASVSGDLREVRATTNPGELEWTLVAVYENIVFILRTVLVVIINYAANPNNSRDMDTYLSYMILVCFHALTVYIMPLGLLFVGDARAALKAILFKAIGLVSCGKLRLGEDLEQLAVSFGQDTGTGVR